MYPASYRERRRNLVKMPYNLHYPFFKTTSNVPPLTLPNGLPRMVLTAPRNVHTMTRHMKGDRRGRKEHVICTLSLTHSGRLSLTARSQGCVYNSAHLDLLPDLTLLGGFSTARIASSNTPFNPFCVRAEHSRYLWAPISLAICSPWG